MKNNKNKILLGISDLKNKYDEAFNPISIEENVNFFENLATEALNESPLDIINQSTHSKTDNDFKPSLTMIKPRPELGKAEKEKAAPPSAPTILPKVELKSVDLGATPTNINAAEENPQIAQLRKAVEEDEKRKKTLAPPPPSGLNTDDAFNFKAPKVEKVENRKVKRKRFNTGLSIYNINGKQLAVGNALDISELGVAIYILTDTVHLDQDLILEFSNSNLSTSFTTKAIVKRITPQGQKAVVGMEFTQVSASAQRKIEKILDQVKEMFG